MTTVNSDKQPPPANPIIPLLVASSIPRTGDESLPGHYDPSRAVWVLDAADGPIPIIRAQKELAETKTITEVKRERTDEKDSILELSTKTSKVPERDDYRSTLIRTMTLLETTTKVAGERTDI
jgi:hypothetical protein